MIQIPTTNAPRIQVTIPRPINSTSGAEKADQRTRSNANQNVRSCQLKCDSSQVPLASSRFT